MQALVAAMALTAPLVLGEPWAAVADDEKNIFRLPGEGDFRLQRIARTGNEKEWPFTVDEGYLTCAYVVGRPAVYFTEMPAANALDRADLRTVIVSTDPFDLAFGNLGAGGLVRQSASIADLIMRMAPFESLGSRLCAQPRGTEVGPGEL